MQEPSTITTGKECFICVLLSIPNERKKITTFLDCVHYHSPKKKSNNVRFDTVFSCYDRRLSVISQFVSPSDCLSLCFEIFIVSKITESISSKHVTKHFWVKGILVYTNEGPHLFPRGDNNEKAEMLLFPLPLWPIFSKPGQHYPCVKGIQVL